MKSFDIEKARLGKPVTTIGGLDPREIFYGKESIVVRHSIGLLLEHDENGVPFPTSDNRTYDKLKLAMATESVTIMTQITRRKSDGLLQVDANLHEPNSYWELVARNIPVTFTEGEGLDESK